MKISDETVSKANMKMLMVYGGMLHADHMKQVVEAVIQAYLKDIWKPFDKDDESTWPDEPVFVRTTKGFGYGVWVTPIEGERYWRISQNGDVLQYCDPADIIPDVYERKDDA